MGIPRYVRTFNATRTHANAPYDSSVRTLYWRLPIRVFFFLAVVVGLAGFGPTILHRMRFVDIDRIRAQTEINPYDLLNIPQGASLSEAKKAYHEASRKFHPDRNPGCGQPCEHKMAEIAKAFEMIKKRLAPIADERNTWDKWAEDVVSDWVAVFEFYNG